MEGSGSNAVVAPHAPLRRYYADEAQRRSFVRSLFDQTAADYDRVEWAMALGTGSRYRGEALLRAGLRDGMRVLDVAIGTGLVARQAIAIVGSPNLVLGLDPSAGMLAQAVANLSIPVIRATAERIPLGPDSFDFLSMGYALRHVGDLAATFGEFYRVLKPGGTLCLLEITRPRGAIRTSLARFYMRVLVPLISRITASSARSPLLWEYYWDTIEACVPPERVLAALQAVGFENVRRHVAFGLFSEYTSTKPTANR